MADVVHSEPTEPALDVDPLASFGSLTSEQVELIQQLMQERDHLFLLQEAFVDVRSAASLDDRLRVFVTAIRRIGFGRVAITLRDTAMDPIGMIASGLSDHEELELRTAPATGDAWRRRLSAMERFRVSQSYYLDGRDEWVRREFRGGIPSSLPAGEDPTWSPHDTLVVPLRGSDGVIVATLVLDNPIDRRRPSLSRIRAVELFANQMAYFVDETRLAAVAARRSDRLQLLHQIGGLLARSLDEVEIVRELARQLPRVMKAEGVVVVRPDEHAEMVITMLRLVRGKERPRAPQPIGRGPIGEVIRSARPVRIADWDPTRVPLAASDDVVGDGGPVLSLLAVPMMVGVELVGVIVVYSSARSSYAAEEEEVLLTIGAQAATALLNARLYAGSAADRRQSEALSEVTRAVSESLQPSEVMALILRHATAIARAEGASIALGTRGDETLEIVATIGSISALKGSHLPLFGSLVGQAVREGVAVISNDPASEPDAHRPTLRTSLVKKILNVPLMTATGAIGALSVVNRREDFTEADARVMQQLANQVAVAIVNARLFGEVAQATREWAVAFDAIASGMAVLDSLGRITRANATAARLIGSGSVREIIGCDFSVALLGDPASAGDPVRQALATSLTCRGTVRVPERGRVYDIVASPHPDGGAVVTFDDVTVHQTIAERHRRVVETTSDAIVITDRQRRIAFVNPAATTLFGLDYNVIGVDVDRLVPPEFREQVAERERLALAGMPQRYEAVLLRGDGERRIVSISTVPLREVNEIIGIVASLRDITDERRARDTVAQSEARYRNLFETASDAIFTIDLEGALTSVNEATCAVSGVPRNELLGRSLLPLLAPEEVERITAHFRAARGGEARRFECTLIRRDGSHRRLSVTNSPIRHAGKVIGVLGIARDTTAERERALALARSEARYSRLVESATDAIFTLDANGHFTSVNHALELATGLPRESLLGAHFSEVIHERDRDAMLAIHAGTMNGRALRGEMHFMGRGGVVREGSLTTTPVVEGSAVVAALGIVRDMTDQKRLTDQLMQQEKLAAIGQLVSGVAHELNNPLAGVIAFSQLLLAGPIADAEQGSALETIHQEAKRAAKIVANLLTFARQHKPQRAVTDVNQVLLDTLELRRYALRMQQVELDISLDQQLPPTWADPFQLQQVFLNLIGNAEQAMTALATGRKLSITTRAADAKLLISFTDTGEGISPHAMDQIFNPFFTTKAVGQGTGLGLSISDGIVRAHGGSIEVESVQGEGATFTIELPLIKPPVIEGEPRSPAASVIARPQMILVVDDERPIRSALATFLTSGGHTVNAVGTGAEAMAALATRRYDLILLDLRLPDSSGERLYERIREMDPAQAKGVVFLTGDLHNESVRVFIASTGRRSLGKPFRLEEVGHLLLDGPQRVR